MSYQNSSIKSELVKAKAQKEKAEASLTLASEFNKSLVSSIEIATQQLEDARKAFLTKEHFNGTAVANVNTAVDELRELVNYENSCGDDRLPEPVIDRMREHYKTQGHHSSEDTIHLSTNG